MKSEDKKQLLGAIVNERDNYQKILSEMRHDKVEKRLVAQSEYDKYISRIGELSLAIAAAITPVLIIANNEVSHRVFLISGIFTYLLTGLASLFWVKQSIEQKVDSYASMNIDLETDVIKITNSINKLILDLENNDYQKEYVEAKTQFTENHSKAKEKDTQVNYTLDLLIGGFMLATVLSIRTVWLSDGSFYWIFILLIAAVFFLLTHKSNKRAKHSQIERSKLLQEYEKTREEYIEWQDKEVFKK